MDKSQIKGFIAKRCAKELKDGDVNLDILSSFQQYADQGIFRRAMFGYTDWIKKTFLQVEKIEKGECLL